MQTSRGHVCLYPLSQKAHIYGTLYFLCLTMQLPDLFAQPCTLRSRLFLGCFDIVAAAGPHHDVEGICVMNSVCHFCDLCVELVLDDVMVAVCGYRG